MDTVHTSGLSGCTARYLHALLASLGFSKVTKAVDTGSYPLSGSDLASVTKEVRTRSFAE